MTEPGREAGKELHGQALCDIAQLLESAEGAEGRVRCALELLRNILRSDRCALLEAEAGCDPRVLTCPILTPDGENELTGTLVRLFGKMLEERALPPASSPPRWSAHLAVPLIGLGEVIGVLFVSRADGGYELTDLRILSVVASQLAAYLMILRARDGLKRTWGSAIREGDRP
jgi:GAF domain-containing protein